MLPQPQDLQVLQSACNYFGTIFRFGALACGRPDRLSTTPTGQDIVDDRTALNLMTELDDWHRTADYEENPVLEYDHDRDRVGLLFLKMQTIF